MAARKKANKRASRTVARRKAAAPSARKRRGAAASSASRSSRTAAKRKAARPAKAKSRLSKSEKARRLAARAARAAAARAKTRATARVRHPKDVKSRVSDILVRKAARPAGHKPATAVEARPAREAAPPATPQGTAVVKTGAAPAVKRPPERDEIASAQKAAKPASQRQGFKLNEFVVYPAHGVGQIVAVEDQEVAGFRLELYVINFAKDKMTLRVPTAKVVDVGMRKLSEPEAAKRSLEILTGRARIKRTMWSRRAQEYEAKINSGDINAIAEVVRDLYRSEAQPEQSYSERQLYEAALDRMMREIAAVQKLSEIDAFKVIEAQLKKSQRRGAKSETVEGEEAAIETAIEEAA